MEETIGYLLASSTTQGKEASIEEAAQKGYPTTAASTASIVTTATASR
jgi:hypothetical protein